MQSMFANRDPNMTDQEDSLQLYDAIMKMEFCNSINAPLPNLMRAPNPEDLTEEQNNRLSAKLVGKV